MKWQTKDGRALELSDMETDHIIRCIHLLERNLAVCEVFTSPWDEPEDIMFSKAIFFQGWVTRLEQELARRAWK